MKITYENKNKIGDLYLHDFNIVELIYNDLDKSIKMKLINRYISKELFFRFHNVVLCEINGMEKINDPTGDIIDWYELSDDPQYINYNKTVLPVGIMLVKASRTTVRIYCEEIEIEGEPELLDVKLRWQ